MKKSQILAALALAFALGVVAPAVSASAVTQGDTTLTTNSQKAAKAAVNEVEQSFDTISTLDTDGDIDDVYVGAAAYGYIAEGKLTGNSNTNANILKTALDYVEKAEKATGDITKAFKGKVASYVSNVAGTAILAPIQAIDEVMDLFRDADAWDNADLATAKATVNEIIKYIDNATKAETDSTVKTKLEMISHNLQEVVTNTEIQKLVDAKVAKGSFDQLASLYSDLTGETAGTITTEAKLNTITTAVKNGLGSANWNKYLRVHKLIKNIEDGLENRDVSDVTLDRWVAQLKNAAGATGDATVEPETPSDTTLKPGNTGLVGSAEGTATTVSIVAGLATALTALGAGVVVYRNARREK